MRGYDTDCCGFRQSWNKIRTSKHWERTDGWEATRQNPWRKLAWFSLANLDTRTSLTLNDHGSSAMGRCQFDWCGFRLCTHRCLEIRSFVFPHVRLRERSFEIWERIWGEALSKGMKCKVLVWVVVSNMFYFHPYLGKWSKLTNIFQMGWNQQLVVWFAASSHN